MKIIYIADDGTQFDNRIDCEEYEQRSFEEEINIKIFDYQNYLIPSSQIAIDYDYVYKIIIFDMKDLEDIKRIQQYYGFYPDVNSIGTWIYNEDNQCWIKI